MSNEKDDEVYIYNILTSADIESCTGYYNK